jgi:hypothetical protein
MQNVTIDKAAMTATAQGGCLAEQVEVAAEAEGLSVVFGNVNETGKIDLLLRCSLRSDSDFSRNCRINPWRWLRMAHWSIWPRYRQSALRKNGSCKRGYFECLREREQ